MRGVKAAIFGASGLGKTTLLRTLNSTTTLFFDLEAGDLAIEGLAVDTIRPRTWKECRDFAVFIGGPNPALRKDQPYSEDHYEAVCAKYGDPAVLEKYDTVFIDSITVAGRLCFQWCKGQPEAHSEKTGKPDVRGAYGLHGREMIAWLTHLQHTRAKNVLRRDPRREARRLQSQGLRPADRRLEDRARAARHRRRGADPRLAARRQGRAAARLRLPHAEPAGATRPRTAPAGSTCSSRRISAGSSRRSASRCRSTRARS